MSKSIADKVANVANILLNAISEQKDKLPLNISAFIQGEMNVGDSAYDKLKATWSESQQLTHRGGGAEGGGLAQSFGNGENSGTVVTQDGYRISATIGSKLPYASIHETGGFIPATKMKTTAGGRSIPKMSAFFWAMWFASNQSNPFFKTMALAVKKNGGVTIKARPYFDPAMKAMEEHYDTVVYPNLEQQIQEAWNAD